MICRVRKDPIGPADVAIVGDEDTVAAGIEQVAARLGQELTRVSLLRYRPGETLPAGALGQGVLLQVA